MIRAAHAITVEARVKGPTSNWKVAKEISRTDTSVEVLRDGKLYTLAPECVRPRKGKAHYDEGSDQ